jgi:hypothetical protein
MLCYYAIILLNILKRGKSWDDDPENGHPSILDLFM